MARWVFQIIPDQSSYALAAKYSHVGQYDMKYYIGCEVTRQCMLKVSKCVASREQILFFSIYRGYHERMYCTNNLLYFALNNTFFGSLCLRHVHINTSGYDQ